MLLLWASMYALGGCSGTRNGSPRADGGPGLSAGDGSQDSGASDVSSEGDGANSPTRDDASMTADAPGDGAPATDGSPLEGSTEGGTPSYACGSAPGMAPSDAGPTTILPSLGHQASIGALYRSGDRVLAGEWQTFGAQQIPAGWILWDVPTGRQVGADTSGMVVALAGGRFLTQQSGIYVHAVSDGSLQASINVGTNTKFGLATDGSYVWAVSTTALTTWSPTAMQQATHPGDYSRASLFAGPNGILVGAGPAGANVIETVSPTTGASTTGPSFSGTFDTWFLDGAHFISTASSIIHVYTASAQLVETLGLSSPSQLGGNADYFYNSGSTLDVYALGGGPQPVASYTPRQGGLLFSGDYVADIGQDSNTGTIVHLTSAKITTAPFTLPYRLVTAFAADASGLWAVGNEAGAIHYEGSLQSPTQAGNLGCGAANLLGGSAAGYAAVATGAGDVLLINVVTGTVEHHLALPATGLQMSADGRTLAVWFSSWNPPFSETFTASSNDLDVIDVPGGMVTGTFSYGPSNVTGKPTLLRASMSLGGTRLGRVLQASSAQGVLTPIERLITDRTGVTVVVDDSRMLDFLPPVLAPQFSPSGDYAALSDADSNALPSTRIYAKGMPVTTVNGLAVGWVDENQLLVSEWVPTQWNGTMYSQSKIYDHDGNLVASPTLPQIDAFEAISSTRIFSRSDATIYDLPTGAVVKKTGLPGKGAGGPYAVTFGSTLVGPYILSFVNRSLVATPY
jgi:hypothetical protein